MRLLQVITLLCACLPAFAGGFFIELANPSASKDPATAKAFLVARLIGCHQPEKGTIKAKAEGLVAGRRISVPVEVSPLSTSGMFAVTRTWPSEGSWVLHLTGIHPDVDVKTTTLVKVRGTSYERGSAKLMMRPATAEEISSLLH
ncbi:MAG: hypothetical protein KIT83_06800 [Bryobacterales bacterium]|nr:hypothetical protein [Bryobacterales bacterium]